MGQVAKGLLQATVWEGLVCWLFVPELEEVDKGKGAERKMRLKRPRGLPRSDLVAAVGVLLVGMLQVGKGADSLHHGANVRGTDLIDCKVYCLV